MSSIEKTNVIDSRFIPRAPKQKMMRGASELAYNEIAPVGGDVTNMSKLQFNIPLTPSNYFDDTPMLYTSFTIDVPVFNAGTAAYGQATAADPADQTYLNCLTPGVDATIANYPLLQVLGECDSSINGTKICSLNLGKYSQVLLKLDEQNNKFAICPAKLENSFASLIDSMLTFSNSQANFNDSTGEDIPNGAWTFNNVNGLQCAIGAAAPNGPVPPVAGGVNGSKTVTFTISTYTPLVGLAPFNWSMEKYDEVQALFGSSSILLNFNVDYNKQHRCIRTLSVPMANAVVANTNLSFGKPTNFKFADAKLIYYSLRQPELVGFKLPTPIYSKHFWDYYTNFIQSSSAFSAINNGVATCTNIGMRLVNSVNMPSKIILWCDKNDSEYSQTQAKYYYPITKLNLDFGTKQNLLSNYKIQDLYRMSVDAGLKSVSYPVFTGKAYALSYTSDGTVNYANPLKQLVGSPIVLIPGVSFPLDSSTVTGSQGNYTFNFNVDCETINATDAGNVYPYLNVMFIYDKWMQVDTNNLAVSVQTANITPSEVLGLAKVEDKNDVDNEEGGVLGHVEHKMNPVRSYQAPAKMSLSSRAMRK